MTQIPLYIAAILQALAVAYGIHLMVRRRAAANAWAWLLGAMLSMLTWRIVILTGTQPAPSFNTTIAIWGSTCMVVAMYQFGREVARRQHAEAARDALLESERTARTEAERASRLKDEFLATVSHELRTPLAAILSWCDLLAAQREESSAVAAVPVTEAVEVIARNARAQARLVDDLLDMTRIQAGSLRLHREAVALDGPVRAALDSIKPAADAKRIRVHLDVPGDPPVVYGDPLRLQQIAANLLVNAVKFTPAEGSIVVSLGSTRDRGELVVADDGEGIDPAFLPDVFARFRQADGASTRRQGGLGLGLAIVDSLVALHGGTVRATSEGAGKGSQFLVSLPLAASAVDAGGGEPDALPQSARTQSEPLRILLVDDDSDIRIALSQLLEQEGCRVSALDSATDVVRELARLRPHVLVCDISMPGEDGYQLIQRIRRLNPAEGGNVPAIALTAHARGEDRGRALHSGYDAHLAKPVDLDLLRATIRRLADAASASR